MSSAQRTRGMTHPSMYRNAHPLSSMRTLNPPLETSMTSSLGIPETNDRIIDNSNTDNSNTDNSNKDNTKTVNENILQPPVVTTAHNIVKPIKSVNRLNQTIYIHRSTRAVTQRERDIALNSKQVRKIVWGPILWNLLHTLGYYFKVNENDSYRREIGGHIWGIIGKLIETVPCPSCKYHASSEYKHTTIPDLSDKTNSNFFELWAFNFHNKVNQRIRHPYYSYTTLQNAIYDTDLYQLVDEYYESIKSNKKRLEKSIITGYIDKLTEINNRNDDITSIDKDTQTTFVSSTGDVTNEISFI